MNSLPRSKDRQRHTAEHRRRQAFDDEVAGFRERLGGNDRNAVADLRQIAPRLVLIAHRDSGQNQARNAGLDPPRHVEADGAEPAQSDFESLSRHVSFPSPTLAAIRPARYIPCLCAGRTPRNSPGVALP